MKDENNKTVDWVDDKDRTAASFQKRFDILVYAAHSGCEFTVKDISEAVISSQLMTIRNCLKDLIKCGYLVKPTIYTFKATEMAKQLFGVKQ